MRNGKPWLRGVVALLVLGSLTIAVIASPVGAAKKGVTGKKAKTIATNTFNSLFPSSFDSMFPGSFNSMFPGSFNSAIGGAIANKQDECSNGAVVAYAYLRGAQLTAAFSTTGITQTFNCAGSAIEARRNSEGDYDVRVPGITTPAPSQDDTIVATLSVGNDTPIYAAYESDAGNDYIEVDLFNVTTGTDDDFAVVFHNNP